MNTVFTPDALQRSVASGYFRKIKLKDWPKTDCDEAHLFVFPSPIDTDQINGDGMFREIEAANGNDTQVWLSGIRRPFDVTPETDIYVR